MLTDAEKQIIIDTLMPFEPTYIGIFGSVARGDDTPESDVDILSKLNTNYSYIDLVTIQQTIENALGRKVDFLTEGAARPWLLNEISSELLLLYGQKNA